jgi:hypothetical protein
MSMFSGNHYYYQQTKAFVTAFGSIFNGVSIEKLNLDGTRAQLYEIPVDFSPKNKWLTMVSERPDYTSNQLQMTLPRLAFEINDMKPNMSRKIGFNGTYMIGSLNNGQKTKIPNPMPIDLTVSLYAITKDNEDMFQIIEQIVPFFQPCLVMNINLLPEFNIFKDIQISLNGWNTEDNYTGSPDEQRLIQTTFTFTVPMYYFGPISDSGSVIKEISVSLNSEKGIYETYNAKVNPPTANSSSVPHTIVESWKG